MNDQYDNDSKRCGGLHPVYQQHQEFSEDNPPLYY